MEHSESARTVLPEISGTVVSLVTALAYAMAFAFEAGTAGAFGIPMEMVDLQLVPALVGMLLSLGVLWSLVQMLDPLIPLLAHKPTDHPILYELKPYVAMLAIGAIFWAAARPITWWIVLVYMVVLFLAYPGLELLFALMRTDSKVYAEKLRQHQDQRLVVKSPILDALTSDLRLAGIVVIVALVVLLSAAAGNGRGRRQQDFYVTSIQPETIVLRIYGNRAIAAEFVRSERRIKPIYRFIRLDEPGTTLTLQRLGPITYTTGDWSGPTKTVPQ